MSAMFPDPERMRKHSVFTTKDGAKIAYIVYGQQHSGVPLIMVNGMSAVMDDWSPLVEGLAKKRKVLIFDHRGIGRSTVPEHWDHELSMESMSDDILSLIGSLGWKVIDILGFSMGGQITQTLLTLPEGRTVDGVREVRGIKFRKAILSATMTKLPRGLKKNEMADLQAEANKIKDKELRKRKMTEEMFKLQYHPEWLAVAENNKNMTTRVEAALATKRPAPIIGAQLLAISAKDTRPDLHRIPSTLPVLIIHGNRDRMVAYSESEYIVKGVPHAKRLSVPGGTEFAHMWYDYFDAPQWTDAISKFLDEDMPRAKL